ncbi:MAG: suppressor of fused domain protein, partial [Mycobacterium sp.]
MTQTLDRVRAHLHSHFADAEPDSASVTFLGTEPMEVLRFRGTDGLVHYVSLGCSRHPMSDPAQTLADPERGPRAEIVLRLRDPGPATGIARSLAILSATPAVDGLVLAADILIDLGSPVWAWPSGRVPFTAVLLGRSDIPDLP